MKLTKLAPKGKVVDAVRRVTGSKAVHVMKQHSPLALTIVGGVGLIATAIFAYKAQPRIQEIVEDMERQEDDRNRYNELIMYGNERLTPNEFYELEKLEVTVKPFDRVEYIRQISGAVALPVFTAIGSVTAIALSYRILSGRVGILSGVVSALTAEKLQQDKRMRESLDEDQYRMITRPTETRQIETVDNTGSKKVIEGEVRREESLLNGVWFSDSDEFVKDDHSYNMQWLRESERKLDEKMSRTGFLLMNEVYDQLGVQRTKQGALMGWSFGDSFAFGLDVTQTMDTQGNFYPEIFVKWAPPHYVYEDVEFNGRYGQFGEY